MPIDICKIIVESKSKMTTAVPSNTIKVFYHPLSVVVNVEKAAGERYFFYGKTEGGFISHYKREEGWHTIYYTCLLAKIVILKKK